jgi:hypothetical protein
MVFQQLDKGVFETNVLYFRFQAPVLFSASEGIELLSYMVTEVCIFERI